MLDGTRLPTNTLARWRACCNMLFRISEQVRYCGCKSAASRISFGVIPFSWFTTLKLFQATFPSIECLRVVSDFQHSFGMRHRFSEKRHTISMVPSHFTFTSTSSSDLMDAIAVSDVLTPNNAYSSELSQSMPVELRSVVLPNSSTFFLVDFTDLSRYPLQLSRKSLVRSCKDSSRTEGPIVVLGMVPKCTLSVPRHHRICPQLLDHGLSHSDLFLLSFSMSLQDRHPCFQSRDPVDELLVLLLCQNHSCHGCDHNTSSRDVQGPMGSATIMR